MPSSAVGELHIPSMKFKTGPRTTWKAAMIFVRGIGLPRIPSFGLEWNFETIFPDHEGNWQSADAPVVDFKINLQLDFAVAVPVFTLYAHMVSDKWIEDALGITNFGFKGIALMVGLSLSAPPVPVKFGFGATAALYTGKKGRKDDVDALTVLGISVAGQFDVTDRFNNCIYF